MRLSEAIRIGSRMRPESHQERFCHVEGRGLCSDVWGAACEAVDPKVARLNWNWNDRVSSDAAMAVLSAVQRQRFGHYFKMPACCPGATQAVVRARGRYVKRGELKVETDYQRAYNVGGVTSECEKVEHLAGLIDHMFYKHGWSREKCAEAVEWYENRRAMGQLFIGRNFEHYMVN